MKNRVVSFIIIFLLTGSIGTFLRVLPVLINRKPPTLDAIRVVVADNIHNNIKRKILESHLPLSKADEKKLIKLQSSKILTENKQAIEKIALQKWAEAKKRKNAYLDNDFLIAADSYYYLGLTKNISLKGKVGPRLKNGLYLNPFMTAPNGHWYHFDLHPYAGYLTYRIMNIFNPRVTISAACGYTSIVLSLIALLVLTIFLLWLKIPPLPAFASTIFFTLSPIYFQRSLIRWYDTDPYNIIFPLCVLLGLMFSFNYIHRSRMYYTGVSCVGIITALYSMFWSGWLYMPLAIMLTFILYLAFNVSSRLSVPSNKIIKGAGLYVISALFFLSLFKGPRGIWLSVADALNRIWGQSLNKFNLWPDMFILVGELKKPSLAKMAVLSGGRVFVLIALATLAYLLYRALSRKNHDHLAAAGLALTPFVITAAFMSAQAERFTIILIAPLSVAFAIGIGILYKKARSLIDRRSLKGPLRRASFIALGLACILATLYPIAIGSLMASREQPAIYNDTWDRAMKKLKSETPPKSIVNSWWSPGHFITSQGRRRVTFDGATLELPQGYWIGRALMTSEEELSVGILRMLNLSGNKAVEYLTSLGLGLAESVKILEHILPLPEDAARDTLLKDFETQKAETLLKLSHGQAPPSYLLIYNNLVENAMALSFVGRWDFSKAESLYRLNQSKPGYVENLLNEKLDGDHVKLLWSISGGPQYYGKESSQIRTDGQKIYFDNGLMIDRGSWGWGFDDADPFTGKIANLYYSEGGVVNEVTHPANPDSPLSILLIEREGAYSALIAQTDLAKSMLFRLYYFDALDTKHFSPFFTERSPESNTSILIFKVT